jgi:cytochrome b involved in lipid metabolism
MKLNEKKGMGYVYLNLNKVNCDTSLETDGFAKNSKGFGELRNDLPTFTEEQVKEHNSVDKRIYVTFKNGVYDITEFIQSHPGIFIIK